MKVFVSAHHSAHVLSYVRARKVVQRLPENRVLVLEVLGVETCFVCLS